LSTYSAPDPPEMPIHRSDTEQHPPSDEVGPEIGELVNLLALAVPSILSFCSLVTAKALQTLNKRLSANPLLPT
jgi:hypothetical protein